MTVGSMYGFNPYMMTNSGYGDDFLANATGLNNQYAQLLQQQTLLQGANQQPTSDTFQNSQSTSGGGGTQCRS